MEEALFHFRTPLLLLMIRHEETRLNANRNPKGGTKVQQRREWVGGSVYTNKNYIDKLKISIASFLFKMKLFSVRSIQNPSQKSFSYEGVNTW